MSITKNGRVVWGPQTAGEVRHQRARVAVSAGDAIGFQIAAGLKIVRWDPGISYQGGPPPVAEWASASWTFTGSQVKRCGAADHTTWRSSRPTPMSR